MPRIWVGVLALLGACYSMSLMQEPKPLPKGAVRGAAGLAFNAAIGPVPTPQVAARVGVVDHVEARLKLSSVGSRNRHGRALGGLEAGFNVQPFDSPYVGVFLMPHYRYYQIREDADQYFDEYAEQHDRRVHAFAMPTLAVFHLQPYDLFIGPDLHVGTRDKRGFLALGGHIGASVAAGRYVSATLEFGLFGTVAGPHGARDQESALSQPVLTIGQVSAEAALSLSFGSAHAK